MKLVFEDEVSRPKKNIIREIIIWILTICLSVLAGYLVTKFAIEKTNMLGSSMEGTLSNGDKIIIDKLVYKFTNPKANDVIVFMKQENDKQFYDIKRIIAKPNDTIIIKDGIVYVNDEIFSEKISPDKINNAGLASEPITLGDDEYFVLGDNRNGSEDSRFASVSLIKKDEIIGKAWLRLNPFGFVSKLTNENKEK